MSFNAKPPPKAYAPPERDQRLANRFVTKPWGENLDRRLAKQKRNMRISRIQIENFRNFRALDVEVGPSVVIVGENAVGKSNLLFALRLILDPTLPDSARQLRREDFWDGLTEQRELTRDDRITVAVDLTDFEENDDQLALLAEHLVTAKPMVARLTYSFQTVATLEGDRHLGAYRHADR